MISKLEEAIQELEAKKNEMFKNIEKSGWKGDRIRKRIPEKRYPGGFILDDLKFEEDRVEPERRPLPTNIRGIYQQWYSASRVILAKNQPDRLAEFDNSYYPKIKDIVEESHMSKKEQFRLMDLINAQFDILAAVPSHLRFSVYDIELTAYSILMDDEIGAARHLLSKGFLRSAGALAGVILERHLKMLLKKHTPPIKYREKDGLSALNDLCKETVYDLVTWGKVQHLTRLRNLCDHDKTREPTKEEVTELINGVSAILKTQM